jgi:hypothetical protein
MFRAQGRQVGLPRHPRQWDERTRIGQGLRDAPVARAQLRRDSGGRTASAPQLCPGEHQPLIRQSRSESPARFGFIALTDNQIQIVGADASISQKLQHGKRPTARQTGRPQTEWRQPHQPTPAPESENREPPVPGQMLPPGIEPFPSSGRDNRRRWLGGVRSTRPAAPLIPAHRRSSPPQSQG